MKFVTFEAISETRNKPLVSLIIYDYLCTMTTYVRDTLVFVGEFFDSM